MIDAHTLLLVAHLIASPAAAQPPEQDLAGRFCRALTADDIREVAPLAADPNSMSTMLWRRVRNIVDNYDCVTVSSYRTWIENGTIVVDADATGITRNGRRERRPIPHLWYLTPTADGRSIAAFDDEQSHFAQRLIGAKSDEERRSIAIDASDELLTAAGHEISDQVPLGNAERLWEPAMFLLQWSQDHDRPETECYALCALGRMDKTAAGPLFDAARRAARRTSSCDAVAYADYQAGKAARDPAVRAALQESVAASIDSDDDPHTGILALTDVVTTACYSSYTNAECFAEIDRLEAVSSRLRNREGLAIVAFYRARSAAMMFDVNAAIPMIGKAYAMAEELRLPRLMALSCSTLSFMYDTQGRRDKAIEALQQALSLLQEPEDDDRIAHAHAHLGQYLASMGRLREADAHFEPALRASRENPTFLQNVLWFGAYLRDSEGRYKEALDFAREAIAVEKDGLDMVWSLKMMTGRILIACGNTDDGIEQIRESIDLIEARAALTTSSGLLRAGFFKSRAFVYEYLLGALVDENRFEEAFAVSEQMKARALADAIPSDAQRLPLTESEKERERRLNQRIFDLNRSLISSNKEQGTDARRDLQAARADLEQFTLDAFMRHSQKGAARMFNDPAQLVAAWRGTTVVEYAVLPDSIVAFVVRNGTVTGKRLPASRAMVEQQAARFLDRIERRDISYAEDARPLHEALIAPLAGLLPKTGVLTIVPDHFLWKLPFDVLRTRTNKYLAQQYAIAYAPSLSMLARAGQKRSTIAGSKEILAFGDPAIGPSTSRKAAAYRNLSLGALPDAVREVRALSRLYGRDQSTVLTGSAARESTLKSTIGRYRIIHLATHGIVDDTSPLYSAIVLASAPGDADDGLLEMREMSDLDLHAGLVVLSGCDTARGDVYTGEGIIGMSWALFTAGCPTTVVSQWKAASRATAQLMIAFHRHLRAGEGKAEALRHARLELMQNPHYRHPFYWAPFVMVGDGESAVR